MPDINKAILDPFTPLSVPEALMVAVCGIVVVFMMLAILALVIIIISKIVSSIEGKAAPAAPAPAPKAAAPAGDGTQVTAPMNGTIARVNCKVGDTVKADAAVIILEAMKMENEIYAGVDGTVKAVQVNTGDAVQPGDVLVVIG